MFKRLSAALHDHFFDESITFETRTTFIFLGGAFMLSVLSAAENVLLEISPWHNIVQVFTALACGITLFLPSTLREKLVRPLLLFSTFVFYPYCFVFNAGINGTVLLFLMLGLYINAMIFRGAARKALLVTTILYYCGIFAIQYRYPSLFTSYGSTLSRFVDFMFAFAVCSITLFWITSSFIRAHENERKRSEDLLVTLEESKSELERLSIRDPLTGLYNRRHLIDSLELEVDDNRDDTSPLCVLMMDLDHFKTVNDTYGHGFGDEVLIAFAKTGAKSLREYDVFARYGGEEFVVLLPVCQPEDAYRIAQRIRQRTEELTFRMPIGITVSIGLALIPLGDTAAAALARADQQLYAAKQNGRNSISCSVRLDLDGDPPQ
ncbi:MAG: GGDEF domain-containing protein [Coriobacteriia bacterium]|nr:GGDEF domain-containing protein [Coriobacteriia bacterium]